ncbi:MAG: hypothetical protein XD40_0152 [Archaeoglobus fulgidus]|uniref:SipW-cognate class signal peptide n=2 Tax=Archaeoglobus fulgidus TaxID=2234 RepID=A0A075WBI2_ARCFL|nr:SipW-dependent-type signal peptide-containing protein [Archaeoglobus fulgidus]AIG96882.1 SipW-cognate class signal peptide [Archaeoglobus fulgidus DSM 8774]KUJ94588.1 MAG: hypothetical protein XD40_0152 [Archaeoglobus fulgidus]KUK07508.1 MAG: hypothetical protein XD48_0287 [Archaeoglobus fulgidus]
MKKFGVLFVAMLVALGLVGATYAYWSDTLTVSGTVGMGNLDVVITSAETTATETYDVATEQDCLIADDGKSVTCNIINAYPGYTATVSVTVNNDGSIPVKPADPDISADDYLDVGSCTWDGLDANGVIAVGSSATMSCTVQVLDGAAENANYEYTITVQFNQFNA